MWHFISSCATLDPIEMVKTGSYIGIASLVFAESGLLVGIFLPGDSLLFTAGLLSAHGLLSPLPLILFVVFAAIAGDSVGYWFGANVGINFFKRRDSLFFKQAYVTRTKHFYQTYGGRAIILARFVPVVRTLAPILAGIGSMRYRSFLGYNAIGGTLWGAGMIVIGYTLGSVFPASEHYILPISAVIIMMSFLPMLATLFRRKAK